MRNLKKFLCVVLSSMMIFSSFCFVGSADEADSIIGTTGSFNMINYNIEGIPVPAGVTESGRDPLLDTLVIGEILNAKKYDIVAIQEDFNYDTYFRELMTNYENRADWYGNVGERHQTSHSGGYLLGDGLNIFSTFSLYNEYRVAWKVTSGVTSDGSDELTCNGFLVTTIEIADGYYVDIYDIHADADNDKGSVEARKAQFAQLAQYIKKHSIYDEVTGTYDHAVIVTGDFNESICNEDFNGDAYLVSELLEAAHLNDAWAVQTIKNIKENPEDYSEYYTYAKETELTYEEAQGHYDSVERICFADGNGIDLTCDVFKYIQITNTAGRSLSSHCAAEAIFSYEIVEKVQDGSHSHDKENVKQEKGFILQFLDYLASIFRAIGKLISDLGNGLI